MSDRKPPFVIHVSEMADFPDAVYIGRRNRRYGLPQAIYGNPYQVKKYGRDGAIEMYRGYADLCLQTDTFDLQRLTGKPLACWCRRSDEPRTDDNMCHGDVLVELWKEQNHDR